MGETIQTFVFVDFEAAQVENEDMKTNSILHFLSWICLALNLKLLNCIDGDL